MAAASAQAGGAVLWRINCGGPAWDSPLWVSTDRDTHPYANPDLKLHWMADTFFTGGGTYGERNAIASSEADTLFQTERWNPDEPYGAKYNIPVPNGDIRVGLYFAEISPDEAGVGRRVFNVYINEQKALENFDIFKLAGANKAYRVEKPVLVTDGHVRIRFENVAHHAKISALEILRAPIALADSAPYRIDCGAEDDWYDKDGNGWEADSHWYGGSLAGATVPVTGTKYPELYTTERRNDPKAGQLLYEFGLNPGSYDVRLHFAEPWDAMKGVGKRVFNVRINDKLALDHFDIFAEAGFAKEIIKEIPLTVSGPEAKARISFENVVGEAKIDAIEILPLAASVLRPARSAARMPAAAVFRSKARDALGRKGAPASPSYPQGAKAR